MKRVVIRRAGFAEPLTIGGNRRERRKRDALARPVLRKLKRERWKQQQEQVEAADWAAIQADLEAFRGAPELTPEAQAILEAELAK